MVSKKLLLLLCLLLVSAAGIAVFIDQNKKKSWQSMSGRNLLDEAVTARATELSISKDAFKLTIHKQDDGSWFITSENFPASEEAVAHYLDRLSGAKIVQIAGKDHTRWQDLGITHAIRVVLTDPRGQHELWIGKDRAGSGGQYVRPTEMGEQVFLVDQNLSPSTRVDDWLLKRVVPLRQDEIKAVSWQAPANTPGFTLQRAALDDAWGLAPVDNPNKLGIKAELAKEWVDGIGMWDAIAIMPKSAESGLVEKLAQGPSVTLTTFADEQIHIQATAVTQGRVTSYIMSVSSQGLQDRGNLAKAWQDYVFTIHESQYRRLLRQKAGLLGTPAAK